MAQVKKLTLKGVVGEVKAPGKGNSKHLANFVGYVQGGFTVDNTTYGDYCTFRGRFKGFNVETGEVFEANRMILPPDGESLLASNWDKAVKAANGNEDISLRFMLKITAVHSEKSKTGYSYAVDVVPLDTPDVDPMQAVIEAATKQGLTVKALPAGEGKKAGK